VIDVKAQIVGAESLVARLKDAGIGYSRRVPDTVHALGLKLLAHVKEDYLSGQALNVRSGRLRRSTNEQFTQEGTSYSSSVGTKVSYGRFWELGFTGLEQVKAHMRTIGRERIATGQTTTYTTKKGVTVTRKRYAEIKTQTQVRAHERRVDVKARPFLQPALADMKDEIRARLIGAVEGGF
jgi:phage gpG-like protein